MKTALGTSTYAKIGHECGGRWEDSAAVIVAWAPTCDREAQNIPCLILWPSHSKPADPWQRAPSRPLLNMTGESFIALNKN